MDVDKLVQIVIAIVIFFTLLVYYFQLRTMRLLMIHQVLKDILMEYRSAEMLIAIRNLWEFYREDPQNFADNYERIRNAEQERIATLPTSEQQVAERSTLHYLRRLVTKYYNFLGGLYELKIIPKKILYTYWNESDLEIIPMVLIPIEKKLEETLGIPMDHNPTLARLLKLYADSRSGKVSTYSTSKGSTLGRE